MAYTIYEYGTVTANGEPVEPPHTRTASQALDAAVRLAAQTVFVAVVPDAAMHLRISAAGTAATTADHDLEASKTYGFPVAVNARPYLYGIAS